MQIRHLDEAVADARREFEFWREQKPGLEEEFAKEVDAAIRSITLSPNGYVKVSKKRELRRFCEKRFHWFVSSSFALLSANRISNSSAARR